MLQQGSWLKGQCNTGQDGCHQCFDQIVIGWNHDHVHVTYAVAYTICCFLCSNTHTDLVKCTYIFIQRQDTLNFCCCADLSMQCMHAMHIIDQGCQSEIQCGNICVVRALWHNTTLLVRVYACLPQQNLMLALPAQWSDLQLAWPAVDQHWAQISQSHPVERTPELSLGVAALLLRPLKTSWGCLSLSAGCIYWDAASISQHLCIMPAHFEYTLAAANTRVFVCSQFTYTSAGSHTICCDKTRQHSNSKLGRERYQNESASSC